MPPDFALTPSPTTPGKLTLAVGDDGDFSLDDTAVFPVMTALHAHKGEWRWAPTLGTLLNFRSLPTYSCANPVAV